MSNKQNNEIGFFNIFKVFFGISAVTIGGGYVMVPIIERAVEKKGWITETEFYDLFALAQSVPGPLALNTAMFVGRRLLGIKGLIAGFLGIILPPFISILIVAQLLVSIGNNPLVIGFLDGASAVIPGLTAALAYNMIKKRKWTTWRVILTVLATITVILSGRWAVPVFFAFAFISWLAERFSNSAKKGV